MFKRTLSLPMIDQNSERPKYARVEKFSEVSASKSDGARMLYVFSFIRYVKLSQILFHSLLIILNLATL